MGQEGWVMEKMGQGLADFTFWALNLASLTSLVSTWIRVPEENICLSPWYLENYVQYVGEMLFLEVMNPPAP